MSRSNKVRSDDRSRPDGCLHSTVCVIFYSFRRSVVWMEFTQHNIRQDSRSFSQLRNTGNKYINIYTYNTISNSFPEMGLSLLLPSSISFTEDIQEENAATRNTSATVTVQQEGAEKKC